VRRILQKLWTRTDGAVAPTVALSLVGLIAAGGIAFDYAHMAAMETELHNAADQAALAAATQLDGQTGAITRAEAAAQNLISNKTLFANDNGGTNVGNLSFTFYSGYDQTTDTFGSTVDPAAAGADAAATVVKVTIGGRTAYFALTPIVGALSSGSIGAEAVASVGHAICKTPPVMMCNPDEPSGNTDESLAYTPVPGDGLKLITGDATVPGNFGWLQSDNGPGASNLAEELGYNSVPGDCQPETGVTTKTGMSTSVLDAFNTRFDVYANGNQTCPSQDGGTCSPSPVTRKDLVCATNGSNPTSCKNKASWTEASKPYQLPQTCTGTGKNQVCTTTVGDLSGAPGTDPTIMGYPPDECHMTNGAGACGITGDGKWDRNAFFRVNYGWADAATWQAQTGLSANATRYQVYQWEMTHQNVGGHGVSVPQKDTGSNYAFGVPATGHSAASQSTSQADRRVMAIAVLNCNALSLNGHSTGVPVSAWMDVFLVQPSASRAMFSDKNVYVEEIGLTNVHTDTTAQVVRRDVPYLIR
jgi:Flp pilus assembly protein TadG